MSQNTDNTGGAKAERTIRLKVRRQDKPRSDPNANQRWEEFEIAWKPGMNIISCLMAIQRNPVTADGTPTNAVVWESNCLEEVCGACTMLVNGKVRQGCSALVDKLVQPITLEPLTSFPVVRDLIVDRSRVFEAFKKVRAWVPIDGTYDLGPGPEDERGRQAALVCAFNLYGLHSLHGSLSELQRRLSFHRTGSHQPGAASQQPPDR